MTIEIACLLVGVFAGCGVTYLSLRPKLDHLERLTDRDERGRFVKRER